MNDKSAIYPDVETRQADIKLLLEQYGTPVVLCETDNLKDRFNCLKRSLISNWQKTQIAYSFKTNYDVAKEGILKEMGAFAEVVSGKEYALAKRIGYRGPEIIYNGPYKDEQSVVTAVDEGATINVNDRQELHKIIELSTARRKTVPVGIRISSTLGRFGHSRFGFSVENEEAAEAVQIISRADYLSLSGLHSHIYGDVDDENIYTASANAVAEFARRFVPDFKTRLRFLNMGGGFPADSPKPYSRTSWEPKSIDVYISAITNTLKRTFGSLKEMPTLVVEPGRYLVNDACLLITRVAHVGERFGKQLVNSNGSISMVPLTHYRPQIIRIYTRDLVAKTVGNCPTILYGATCRENDILFEGEFPRAEPGDILIHFGIGAYNSSLTPDFIFERPGVVFV